MKLSLVIPCYNETGRIPFIQKHLQAFIDGWGEDFEIIFVNDGSSDGTARMIMELPLYRAYAPRSKIILVDLPLNRGKGGALKTGVARASGAFILTLDADMSTDPFQVIRWRETDPGIFSGRHILVGSREHPDSIVHDLPVRRLTGRIFNALVRCMTPLRLRDTQCGFKLYPSSIGKYLFRNLKNEGWAHDVELLCRAHLARIDIVEMPLTWTAMPDSKVSLVRDSRVMFSELVRTWLILVWNRLNRFPFMKTINPYNSRP